MNTVFHSLQSHKNYGWFVLLKILGADQRQIHLYLWTIKS